MNAETRPEMLVPADDSVSVSDLQDIRDIRIEREKKINGGRGRPSARTLRLRAERAREGAYYLSPSADPERLPVGFSPATTVAHGCCTPATKNARPSNALQGEDESGAVLNQYQTNASLSPARPTPATTNRPHRKEKDHDEIEA